MSNEPLSEVYKTQDAVVGLASVVSACLDFPGNTVKRLLPDQETVVRKLAGIYGIENRAINAILELAPYYQPKIQDRIGTVPEGIMRVLYDGDELGLLGAGLASGLAGNNFLGAFVAGAPVGNNEVSTEAAYAIMLCMGLNPKDPKVAGKVKSLDVFLRQVHKYQGKNLAEFVAREQDEDLGDHP
jgi:hypothetical protein